MTTRISPSVSSSFWSSTSTWPNGVQQLLARRNRLR